MIRILVTSSHFSAAHFYKNENFSVKENEKAFGRCYTEFGHGHNYKIEVGFVVPSQLSESKAAQLQKKLSKEVFILADQIDHSHLNFDIQEFSKTIPTTENILLYFEKKILSLKLPNTLAFIKLFEAEHLFSEKYYVTIY